MGGRVKQNPNSYHTSLDKSAGCFPAAPNINHCCYWCQRGPRHRIDNRIKPHPASPYTSVERHTGVSPNHTTINTLFLPSRMSSTLTQRLKERRGGDRIDTYIQRRTSTDTQLKPHIYAESITTMFVDLLVLARLRFGCDCSLP